MSSSKTGYSNVPEPWQSWVKIDIDAWQGSATVQEMTDAEYRAYDNLLKAQFQQPDGMLPNDEKELAKLSRKRPDWPQIREHVLEQFKQGPDGRIFNERMYSEWLKAKELHLKRKNGGRATSEKRWVNQPDEAGHSPAIAQQQQSGSSAIAQLPDSEAEQPVRTERNVTERNVDGTERQKHSATRVIEPEEHESIAAQIVCAHPSAISRSMGPLDMTQSQAVAVLEAVTAECLSSDRSCKITEKPRAVAQTATSAECLLDDKPSEKGFDGRCRSPSSAQLEALGSSAIGELPNSEAEQPLITERNDTERYGTEQERQKHSAKRVVEPVGKCEVVTAQFVSVQPSPVSRSSVTGRIFYSDEASRVA
jgi:hypothetical protein